MIIRHADHGPGVICRPAFGTGLCEPLGGEVGGAVSIECPWCHAMVSSRDMRCPDYRIGWMCEDCQSGLIAAGLIRVLPMTGGDR